MVSALRGWGTQRAYPGAPAMQHLCPSRLREPAPSGPPLGPLMRSVEPPVRAGDQASREPTLGPLQHSAVVRLRPEDPAPSGPPLGPPEAPCGKEWLAMQHCGGVPPGGRRPVLWRCSVRADRCSSGRRLSGFIIVTRLHGHPIFWNDPEPTQTPNCPKSEKGVSGAGQRVCCAYTQALLLARKSHAVCQNEIRAEIEMTLYNRSRVTNSDARSPAPHLNTQKRGDNLRRTHAAHTV